MDVTRAEKRRINRQHLWAILHDGKGRLGHAFNFGLIALILVSVALVPLEFLPDYRSFATVVHTMEAILVGLFTVEYGLRIYAAPSRWRYIFSFFGFVDLLSIVPFYSGIFGTEYVRILRLVRLLKLGEIEAAAQGDEVETMQHEVGLMEGEEVMYVVTKSPVTLIFGVIPPIVSIMFGLGILLTFEGYAALAMSVALFIFALIFLWKAWLDFSYDVIYLTNYRLVFQNQHILGRSINQVNYHSITNVKPYYPGPLSYLMRFGSLVIDTAAENPGQIGLHTVRDHEKAANMIMKKAFESNQEMMTGKITSRPADTATDQPASHS